MKYLAAILLVLAPVWGVAQFSLTGTSPANGATSVPSNSVIFLAFNAPIDTSFNIEDAEGFFTSVDSVQAVWFSPSRDSIYLAAVLGQNRAHFIHVYGIKSATGQVVSPAAPVYFTTGASFPPFSISGTVQPGTTGFDPGGSMVVVTAEPISDGPPRMIMGALANGSGVFTIPYLGNGTYYPLAAKDGNADGEINPERGDPIAFGDSVVVSGANITGLTLEFISFAMISLGDAWVLADPAADTGLPADKVLRAVWNYRGDFTGVGWDWEFLYTSPSLGQVWMVRVSPMGVYTEQRHSSEYSWLAQFKPMPSPGGAAASTVFAANVEAAGGAAFRAAVPPSYTLDINYTLGDIRGGGYWDLVPDTSQFYWGAAYRYGHQIGSDSFAVIGEKRFVGSFSTGEILVVTDVAENPAAGEVPGSVTLMQNYPNPFNPTTDIRFLIPSASRVTLEVIDVVGRTVAKLSDGELPAGLHQVRWEAPSTTGVYFSRLTVSPLDGKAAPTVQVRKMMLMR